MGIIDSNVAELLAIERALTISAEKGSWFESLEESDSFGAVLGLKRKMKFLGGLA